METDNNKNKETDPEKTEVLTRPKDQQKPGIFYDKKVNKNIFGIDCWGNDWDGDGELKNKDIE